MRAGMLQNSARVAARSRVQRERAREASLDMGGGREPAPLAGIALLVLDHEAQSYWAEEIGRQHTDGHLDEETNVHMSAERTLTRLVTDNMRCATLRAPAREGGGEGR